MEFVKIKDINIYKSQSVDPSKSPEQIYEVYSVPSFDTKSPEYLRGAEIGSTKVKVKKHDVLLCKINPRINRVWVVGEPCEYPSIASSEWIIIRTENMNPYYLAWYFKSPLFQAMMTSEVTGIGGSLTRAQPKRVAEYPIPLPSPDEQKHVTLIFESLQAVINNRKQQLTELDTLVKARFVEMFGDPVANPYNWPTKPLLNMGRCKNGMNFHAGDDGIEIHCLGVGDFKDLSVIDGTENLPLVSLNELPSDEYMLQDGDIVFVRSNGNKALVGRCLVVYPHDVPTTYSGFCIRYRRTDNDVTMQYLLRVLKAETMRKQMTGRGANIQNLNQQILAALNIPIPPQELQQQFSAFVTQTDKSKVVVQKALDEAQTLFDSLMQQYFGYEGK